MESVAPESFFKKGVPQSSIFSLILFKIYVFDKPVKKVAPTRLFADDSAVQCDYFENWRLVKSCKITVAITFHLSNEKFNREISIRAVATFSKTETNPTKLGVVLDRFLTFGFHFKQLAARSISRDALLPKLQGTSYG